MKKYAIIPVNEVISVASSYNINTPNESVLNVTIKKDEEYQDLGGVDHILHNIITCKIASLDNWQQINTDEINDIWDNGNYGDEVIRISDKHSELGSRYDSLAEYIFEENRYYPIWSDIVIYDFEFTNLDQSNTDSIIDNMYVNIGNLLDDKKIVKFNTKPSENQLNKLNEMVRDNNMIVTYYSPDLSDDVYMI